MMTAQTKIRVAVCLIAIPMAPLVILEDRICDYLGIDTYTLFAWLMLIFPLFAGILVKFFGPKYTGPSWEVRFRDRLVCFVALIAGYGYLFSRSGLANAFPTRIDTLDIIAMVIAFPFVCWMVVVAPKIDWDDENWE